MKQDQEQLVMQQHRQEQEQLLLAGRLVNTFIAVDAPQEVNLSHKDRTELVRQLRQLKQQWQQTALGSQQSAVVATAQRGLSGGAEARRGSRRLEAYGRRRDLFDKAYREVEGLVDSNLISRFLLSQHFARASARISRVEEDRRSRGEEEEEQHEFINHQQQHEFINHEQQQTDSKEASPLRGGTRQGVETAVCVFPRRPFPRRIFPRGDFRRGGIPRGAGAAVSISAPASPSGHTEEEGRDRREEEAGHSDGDGVYCFERRPRRAWKGSLPIAIAPPSGGRGAAASSTVPPTAATPAAGAEGSPLATGRHPAAGPAWGEGDPFGPALRSAAATTSRAGAFSSLRHCQAEWRQLTLKPKALMPDRRGRIAALSRGVTAGGGWSGERTERNVSNVSNVSNGSRCPCTPRGEQSAEQ